ncbi:unannotated protein [freshwater metagenome]|uniref:dihydropteroate synthase n=1 Tax=freshwater metagenome TaxID=449393 RepID=A0A6J6WGL6_9ZZZZ
MFTWKPLIDGGASVMGILNVTPDSFSDGGLWFNPELALEHAQMLVKDGADVIDVGGESTRPGALPVSEVEESARVVPLIAAIARSAIVSVDTMKASVARAAIEAGARIVNDVSGGRHDPEMLRVVAESGVGFIAMHMQGEPRTMQLEPHYSNVVREVTAHLVESRDRALDAGVSDESIMLDPGIGFGKSLQHNLSLLAHIDEIGAATSSPILIGASRKSFIGSIQKTGSDTVMREDGTTATTVWALEHGASMVRVHNVADAHRAVEIVRSLAMAGSVCA